MCFPRKSIVATCCSARLVMPRAVRASNGRAACAHLNRSYKNMIVPCAPHRSGAAVAFLLPPQQVYTAPQPPVGDRGYPPWELYTHTHIHTHAYIRVRCYPDRIASYRRHVSPSYIIFGCKPWLCFARSREGSWWPAHDRFFGIYEVYYIGHIYRVYTHVLQCATIS